MQTAPAWLPQRFVALRDSQNPERRPLHLRRVIARAHILHEFSLLVVVEGGPNSVEGMGVKSEGFLVMLGIGRVEWAMSLHRLAELIVFSKMGVLVEHALRERGARPMFVVIEERPQELLPGARLVERREASRLHREVGSVAARHERGQVLGEGLGNGKLDMGRRLGHVKRLFILNC